MNTVTFLQIQHLVDRIVKEFAPERIILFGSYASGHPTPDSDVDLFIVIPSSRNFTEQALDIRQRINCDFPLDLIVRSPEEIRRRLKAKDNFFTTILNEGKTLYECSRSGMD